ncbi:MAG: hypothetical protein ABFC63_05800 [Thermoguttaceae bacterium]
MVANKKSVVRGIKGKPAVTAKKPIAKSSVAEDEVTIDRRDKHERRQSVDRRTHSGPVAEERRVVAERRVKVSRRRQIDPTTCERDYTPEEIEFMGAMDSYKRRSGRMFPTCSEVLEVIKSLGYEKPAKSDVPSPMAIDLSASMPMTAISTVHLV